MLLRGERPVKPKADLFIHLYCLERSHLRGTVLGHIGKDVVVLGWEQDVRG